MMLLGVMVFSKLLRIALSIAIGAIAGILIWSAIFALTGFSLFGEVRDKPPESHEVSNADLCDFAFGILSSINSSDYDALSRVAHPDRGVLFSPYATVDVSTNKSFSSEEIAAFGTDNAVYIWGVNSLGGEPIEMTPADYFSSIVNKRDYASAPFIGINHIIRSGNALENISDVFPNMQFVEFHFPGSGSKQNTIEDVDWCTLRLGFDSYDGRLWLTAIINSKWSA